MGALRSGFPRESILPDTQCLGLGTVTMMKQHGQKQIEWGQGLLGLHFHIAV